MKQQREIVLGLIPARGGSKGIKKKNLCNLLGKPLIAHAIECGLACPFIDKLVVSTDDPEIAAISKSYGAEVPFLRPSELAEDNTPMLPVIQHAIKTVEAIYQVRVNTLILLDATSPLRKLEDIEKALAIFKSDKSCQAVISGCNAHHNPYFNMVHIRNGYVELVINTHSNIGRRQDCPPVFDLDTTVWIYSREALMDLKQRIPPRTLFYKVPEERSFHIDHEIDLKFVEFLLSQKEFRELHENIR